MATEWGSFGNVIFKKASAHVYAELARQTGDKFVTIIFLSQFTLRDHHRLRPCMSLALSNRKKNN